ncbi:MAG: nucleotide exchange factor GrpE [Phycisphaeraceae bacterium]|nr:nucleotide exchange factor GrpE [Phycisphaeraceae bacterium]
MSKKDTHESSPPEGQEPREHDISDAGAWQPEHGDRDQWKSEWGPESAEEAIARVTALESELTDTKNKLLRTVADYQNSQRRALQNEQQAKADGVSRIVSDVAVVLDHFDLALGQDPSKVTPDQLIGGVRVIREELVKILSRNGVALLQPQPNDEFQPGRHEAVMQQPADGIEPGRIVATFQPGFLLTTLAGERVIRPAKVAVAPSA